MKDIDLGKILKKQVRLERAKLEKGSMRTSQLSRAAGAQVQRGYLMKQIIYIEIK